MFSCVRLGDERMKHLDRTPGVECVCGVSSPLSSSFSFSLSCLSPSHSSPSEQVDWEMHRTLPLVLILCVFLRRGSYRGLRRRREDERTVNHKSTSSLQSPFFNIIYLMFLILPLETPPTNWGQNPASQVWPGNFELSTSARGCGWATSWRHGHIHRECSGESHGWCSERPEQRQGTESEIFHLPFLNTFLSCCYRTLESPTDQSHPEFYRGVA